MSFVHRHLAIPPGTPPDALPLDALDDLLERGDFDDWRPLATAVRADPHGSLAERIIKLCRSHDMFGTSQLWLAFIARLRADSESPGDHVSLATLRRQRECSQSDVARALGISQSDVSKLERRTDTRVSMLRRYVRALGGDIEIVARFNDKDGIPIALPVEPTPRRRR